MIASVTNPALAVLPTGYGKTLAACGAYAIVRAQKRADRFLVVPTVDKRTQWAGGAKKNLAAEVMQKAEPRRPRDDYPTPEWCIRAIAPHVAGKVMLDPCCGAGAILDVFRELGFRTIGIEISEERAAEARAKGHEVIVADALTVNWPAADLVITNPPYSFALEFATKAIASVLPGGTVAMLLRLGFLESKARIGFHRANGSSVYVLSSRPSFTGNGKTDASAYGWFLWGQRHSRTLHFLDALDTTRRPRVSVPAAPEHRPIREAPTSPADRASSPACQAEAGASALDIR